MRFFWQEKKHLYSLLVYYPHREGIDVLQKELSKFSYVLIINKESELLSQTRMKPDCVLLFDEKYVHTKSEFQKMFAPIKERYPSAGLICSGIHFSGEAILHAGADYFLDLEPYTSSKMPDEIIFGIGRGGLAAFQPTVIKKMLAHWCSSHNTQSAADLESEKKAFYNAAAAVFDERAKKTADTKEEVAFLNNILHKIGCKNILDVGCGKGRLAIHLATSGFSVLGIDISDALLAQAAHDAKGIANISFKHMSALDIGDEYELKFDAVIMFWHVFCEFKGHQANLLKVVNRVLKMGGVIIFDIPDATKNNDIKNGVYTVNSSFGTYVGNVPDLKELFFLIETKASFHDIEYYPVTWGTNNCKKFVVVARKHGFYWKQEDVFA